MFTPLFGTRCALPLSCAKGERLSRGPVPLSKVNSIGDSWENRDMVVSAGREVGRGIGEADAKRAKNTGPSQLLGKV